MFRALWWKEWSQLGLLRWGGVGLGLLVPLALLVAAEVAQQGWTPFGTISTYSVSTLIEDVAPMALGLAVWPLLALMLAAQAFVGDRAAGTEPFLLERPVPRSRIWQVKLLAATGSTAVVVFGNWLIWRILVLMVGRPEATDAIATSVVMTTSSNSVWRAVPSPFLSGGISATVALIAGTAAAAFVRTPVQGVLLGFVFSLVPLGFTGIFAALFPGVGLQGFHLGWIFPLLLLFGFLAASFLMTCRGEPAGRGKTRRGLIALGAAFAAVPLCFAAAAPLVMRWDAALGLSNTTLLASSSGRAALALNSFQRAAWLIDTAAGRKLRFLAPPVIAARWNRDGTRLAVVRGSGDLGQLAPTPRIDLFDTDGLRVGDPIPCSECRHLHWREDALQWAGDDLVVGGDERLTIIPTREGRRRTIERDRPGSRWTLLGPTERGELYVFTLLPPGPAGPGGALQRLDLERGVLEAETILEGADRIYFARKGLAPSGRYWLRYSGRGVDASAIVDLETGAELPAPGTLALWLAGDRLAWSSRHEGTVELVIGRPGESHAVRSWPAGTVVMLSPSPDGRRLLVRVRTRATGTLDELWIYEPDADRWLDVLPQFPSREARTEGHFQWAGPRTLALSGRGFLALGEAGERGEPRFVIGRR